MNQNIIPNYNPEYEYLLWNSETEEWCVMQIQIKGDYYLKINGTYANNIDKKSLMLYTLIPIIIREGDIVHFDDDSQTWIYDIKGAKTIEIELNNAKIIKMQNIAEIAETYKTFHVITHGEYKLNMISTVQDKYRSALENSNSNGYASIFLYDVNDSLHGAYSPYLFLVEIFYICLILINNNDLYYLKVTREINALTTIQDINDYQPVIVEFNQNLAVTATSFYVDASLNINNIIDSAFNKTDAELIADDYTPYQINIFREWVSTLLKDESNNYIIMM